MKPYSALQWRPPLKPNQRFCSPWAFLVLLLAVAGALVFPASPARAQVALTGLFTVPTGTGNIVTSGNNRGLAYDAVSNLVYVTSSGGSIGAYDGTAGTYVGPFNTTGYYSGSQQFALDQIGVAADGAIYVLNLSLNSGQSSVLYRYPAWNANYVTSYTGNTLAKGGALPTSGRVGDTLAVTGSGTNTLILAGVGGNAMLVLFSTVDGTNFTPTILNIPSGITIGPNVFGLTFYTNNTFLVKPASSSSPTVYLIQFPTNFAAQSVASGTVLATTSLGGAYNNTTLLSYAPGASYLAAVQPGTTTTPPVELVSAPNIAGGVNQLSSTNLTAPNSNGNNTGGVALGGKGLTNVLYALDTANALFAFTISNTPPVPPTISTAPAGGTFYLTSTLSVGAAGSIPLYYFWQASSNDSTTANTFTNIPGATASSLTINGSTNYYQVIVSNSVGSLTSSPVQVSIIAALTNSAVTNLWRIAPGQSGYAFLPASGDNTRGLADDTNSQRVVVASTGGLYVLNATNGAYIEPLSLTGVSFGGLLGGADQVGIADDGAVYAGNVVSAPGTFNLYRWSNPSNIVTAAPAYSGDPGNGQAGGERWGDTLAVRGAGPNTQILLASRASAPGGTNVAFLTPNDGVGLTYSSQLIAVSNVPAGFAAYGITFGAGNTFWAKTAGGDLYEIAYDTNLLTGTVVYDYKEPSQIASGLICAGVDPVHNIFASITEADSPHDLQLFQLTGNASEAPVLFQQSFFAAANANGNGNAVVTVKYPHIYALDVNNGLVAVTYGTPAATAPSITTPPASITAYTNVGSLTLSVGASGSLPLYFQWRYNSNNIPGATSGIYVITNTALKVGGYYDVVVRNLAGSITSTPPALVTLIPPVSSPLVTPVWSIGPGTNGAWLTSSGNETRGLAYDPTTTNLFVADHSLIHVYSGTNGSYLYDLNTAGIPSGGINGWTVDQVGVADDGTLYSANLSPDGTAFSIISYSPGSYGLNYAYGGSTGGNDLNTLDPAGDRWGDTMAVRGSGVNTEILFGSLNGTNVALFTTPDGQNFMPTLIAVQGGLTGGFAGLGIAFGTNNTFYAKGGHYFDLREVAFDPVAGTGTVLQDYLAGLEIPDNMTGIGVDVTNNILGGVCFDDSPNDAQLYLLSGNTNAPALFNQDFFPAVNPNGNYNAVTVLKGGLGFALNVNNGIVAFTYSRPAAPAVTLTSVAWLPHSVTITWNNTFDGHNYQVYYKNHLLDAAWTLLGTVNATNATASFTDTTANGATRFYRVVSQ